MTSTTGPALAITPRGTLTGARTLPSETAPLVLLHAFPLDHRMWEPAAGALVDLPLLLVDLPGAGMSPVVEPTLAAAAEALADSLAAWGASRWVVAGVSMGGYVAMALARSHPDPVAGLALIDTKAAADDDAARVSRHEVARRVLAENSVGAVIGMAEALVGPSSGASRPELVAQVREWIASGDAAGIAWAEAAMASRPDSSGTLRGLRCPATVIVGDEDQLSPPAVARQMAGAIPGATLNVVAQAGHLSPVEQPEQVAAALRDLYGKALARA
ncbi:MAG: alpha/beta hydrolase [Bifidobacteriaceae bacterium]|jgi:pimeloyl-ACP methyl ester carboxylesterase|nr:alpha/beta hydrolase [Bifidobacteriaceae bacterium]